MYAAKNSRFPCSCLHAGRAFVLRFCRVRRASVSAAGGTGEKKGGSQAAFLPKNWPSHGAFGGAFFKTASRPRSDRLAPLAARPTPALRLSAALSACSRQLIARGRYSLHSYFFRAAPMPTFVTTANFVRAPLFYLRGPDGFTPRSGLRRREICLFAVVDLGGACLKLRQRSRLVTAARFCQPLPCRAPVFTRQFFRRRVFCRAPARFSPAASRVRRRASLCSFPFLRAPARFACSRGPVCVAAVVMGTPPPHPAARVIAMLGLSGGVRELCPRFSHAARHGRFHEPFPLPFPDFNSPPSCSRSAHAFFFIRAARAGAARPRISVVFSFFPLRQRSRLVVAARFCPPPLSLMPDFQRRYFPSARFFRDARRKALARTQTFRPRVIP